MELKAKEAIKDGKVFLGIELGSTRIKAVLIDEKYNPIASGGYDWENRLENGIWTYPLDDVWTGLKTSFKRLSDEAKEKYGVSIERIGGLGISGMMHGYLVFDESENLLAPFRTWRNTITAQAAEILTERFGFNIPQRWSIAHLYQAILNNESHIKDIKMMTTLAGYVHWKLTGQNVLGIGEASGVFPIDSTVNNYNARMLTEFDVLTADKNIPFKIADILPKVLNAGDKAGTLTEEGAKLLDPTGTLRPSVPLCPPEGDAGTGMVATNSIAERTGNVSAGTSVFAMLVLEKELSKVYMEIDMVTTPTGRPVAMVHCNSCTSDLDAWVKLFGEALEAAGTVVGKSALYELLYNKALDGDTDCGGLLAYNYYAGEPITDTLEGRPLFVRQPDGKFSLANLMRTLLFSAMGTLKLGMDILTEQENVRLDTLLGHGGLFKTKGVGQRLMAAALNVPVAVMESAGEGGAWGVALLAAYMAQKTDGESLDDFLAQKVFAHNKGTCVEPDKNDIKSFECFISRYKAGIEIEKAACKYLK